MIPRSSPLFSIADHLADAVNPILVICLVIFFIIATRHKEIDGRAWAAAILGIALVYFFQSLDHRLHLWKQIEGDYSTHSALAASVVIPLIYLRRRLWPLLAGTLAGYALLMIVLGFHTFVDVATTLLVIMPLVVLLHFVLLRKSEDEKNPVEKSPVEAAS